MSVFSVDGVAYPGIHVVSLKRSFSVLDGENTGRVMTGAMVRDIIGTFYNYSMELDSEYINRDQYDSLYEVISAPVESHEIVVPYGQGTLTFEAYVSNGEDTLDLMDEYLGYNRWNNLTINFIAMAPERIPE